MRAREGRSNRGPRRAALLVSAAILALLMTASAAPAFAKGPGFAAPRTAKVALRRASDAAPAATHLRRPRGEAAMAAAISALAAWWNPITPSPISSSLGNDSYMVYRVYLNKGQKLSASLVSPAASEFDLYVYDIGTTDVWDPDFLVAWSEHENGTQYLDYAAPVSGYYYLAVYAYTGSGAFTAKWGIDAAANDDIPGAVLPSPSPMGGFLDEHVDFDDVYKVYLTKDQQVNWVLDGAVDTSFTVDIYDDTASTLTTTTGYVASVTQATYPKGGIFTATKSGWFYFDTWAPVGTGSGNYTITWSTAGPNGSAAPLGPIAYDLKSFQTTRFKIVTDQDGVTAKLTIPTSLGTATLYNGAAAAADQVKWTPQWNGLVGGKRVPAGNYKWTLTLTNKMGKAKTVTGNIIISNIYFVVKSSDANKTFYMKKGSANCYLAAQCPSLGGTLNMFLKGPSLSYRQFATVTNINANSGATVYLRSPNAPVASGKHTFTMSPTKAMSYSMGVIQ